MDEVDKMVLIAKGRQLGRTWNIWAESNRELWNQIKKAGLLVRNNKTMNPCCEISLGIKMP